MRKLGANEWFGQNGRLQHGHCPSNPFANDLNAEGCGKVETVSIE
jgi:hypothetical protein